MSSPTSNNDLVATGDPDILLFAYEESRPCGMDRRLGPERDVPFDATRLIAAAREILAASARTFLRGRARRLRVIPSDLLEGTDFAHKS